MVSVLLGFALVGLRPEARDTFFDEIGVAGAAWFGLLLLVWSIQLHQSVVTTTRNIPLSKEVWPLDRIDRFSAVFFGILPTVIILLGVWLGRQDLLRCEHIASAERLANCHGISINTAEWQFQPDSTSAYSVPEVDASLLSLSRLAWAALLAAGAFLLYVRVRTWIVPRCDPRFLACMSAVNIALMGGLLIWTFYWPLNATEWFSRLSLVPVLLGVWLPIADGTITLSRRVGLPVGTIAAILIIVFSTTVGRFNDVRLIEGEKWHKAQIDENNRAAGAGPQRQSFLDDSIERWMGANGCDARHAEQCPPVVLVAAEGGGSRAAFFTATVLGTLLDSTRKTPGKYVDFGRAVFAISGVSGGAVGATLFRTALLDSNSSLPPCKNADAVWFGSAPAYAGNPLRNPATNWRSCLQVLAAGDFLSPVMVGLLWRDGLPLLSWSDDRAVLLEKSIERHYNGIVHGDRTWCGDKEGIGLCRPFGYLDVSPGSWTPLLLLNATSTETGRPILISDIYTATPNSTCAPLSVSPLNVFELYATYPFIPRESEQLADEMPSCLYPYIEQAADLRLSTAAVLSARFPAISPSAAFRYTSSFRDSITQHAVDGGYFDNSGLETISQIIPELEKRRLRPAIIHLVNAPWSRNDNMRAGRPFAGQSIADEILTREEEPAAQGFWTGLLSLAADPIDTILQVRAGHQEAALERLVKPEHGVTSIRAKKAIFNVDRPTYPDATADICIDRPPAHKNNDGALYEPVLSWWLSYNSQRSIDAQLCDVQNLNQLGNFLGSLRKQPANASDGH
jgi:hypothetical protein